MCISATTIPVIHRTAEKPPPRRIMKRLVTDQNRTINMVNRSSKCNGFLSAGKAGIILNCIMTADIPDMRDMTAGEHFDILDDDGCVIGAASRRECHAGTFLLHGVVHVMVERSDGTVLLQKRSPAKDVQPGKWDTSVGGHIGSGERVEDALRREAAEELGIADAEFRFMYRYVMESAVEREMVWTYRCVWDGPVAFDPEEITEVRVFSPDEIDRLLGTGFFSPNFEDEWKRFRAADASLCS